MNNRRVHSLIPRRHFLRTGLFAGVGLPLLNYSSSKSIAGTTVPLFTKMGINAGFNHAADVAAAGADFLLLNVNSFLMPNASEAEFEQQLALQEKSPLPVRSCNNFLSKTLRSVGPGAKHASILKFANKAFQRAKQAGVERIVLGSSASRSMPQGWSKEQADEQFIDLLKAMGDLAAAQGVILAIENLRQDECNYLTRLREVGELVTAVDHPHIRMLADLYHASVMQDPPEDLQKYAHLVNMVEIAEAKGRTVPGVGGQDFRPYFQALRAGGYHGPIEIEGKWSVDQVDQVATAFQTIREQSA